METLARHDPAQGWRESCSQPLPLMRAAQHRWADTSTGTRTSVLRNFREAVAADPKALAQVIQGCRRHSSIAEILTSEILPLLDACKFAEKNAARLLKPRKLGSKGRPFWLTGVHLQLNREPFGLILIIAPSNYPLFLAGVQALQALVVGNAVLVKPAPGTEQVASEFRRLLIQCGLEPSLLTVLEHEPASAISAIREGVDKIVLTGSEETGRQLLHVAADTITPVTCELSGCDAMIVLPGADAKLVASAVHFGLRLNASQTCMRPHRVLVHASLYNEVLRHTQTALADLRVPVSARSASQLQWLVGDALRSGHAPLGGTLFNDGTASPFIFDEVNPTSSLWRCDVFAPVLAFQSYHHAIDMLESYDACPYALGAAIFGPEDEAQQLASRLDAGFVTVNDVIVPTADPRVPFGGRKCSGFGVTRGEEGLLEFSRVKAISTRRNGHLHFQSQKPEDEELFAGLITTAHSGSIHAKLRGILTAGRAAMKRKHESGESS